MTRRAAEDPQPIARVPERAGPSSGTAILRINPLPAQHFTTPAWRAAVDRLHTAAATRDALTEPACDALYDLVGTATADRKGPLLNLKRDVYNGRRPELEACGPLPSGVRSWLDAQQAWDTALAAVDDQYPDALAAERTALARLAADPDLQRSLVLASPSALDAVQRYRADPPAPGTRVLKTERGIVQYVTRAMVRTSPLSRFTAVGLYDWSADDGDGAAGCLDMPRVDWAGARSAVRVDAALFGYVIAGAFNGQTDGGPHRVRSAPSLQLGAHHVQWHRTDGRQARVLSASLTRNLHTLLMLCAVGARTVDALTEELQERLRLSPRAAAQLVTDALKYGLLVSAGDFDEQTADPVRHAVHLLGDGSPRLCASLTELTAITGRFADAEATERRHLLDTTEALSERITVDTGRPARLQPTEDRLLPPGRISPHGYREALADLASYLDVWSVFDRQLEIRELLKRAVTDRIGPGCDVPLIDWAEDLVMTILRREQALDAATAADFGPCDGRLALLLDTRETIRESLIAALSGPTADGPGGQPEAVLSPELVRELSASVPDVLRSPSASYAIMAQPVDGQLVVNDIYPGHGLAWSRFMDPAHGSPARLAERLHQLYGSPGTVLAEDRGLHGSGINLRPQVLEHTLDADAWARLRLVHDATTGQLTLHRPDGTPVRPVILGMKWPELLPAPVRLATWMFDTGRIVADPTAETHRRHATGIGTVRHPRLRLGQVIAQRARWYPGHDLTTALDTAEGAPRMAALTQWRVRHGVPAEIVLRTPPDRGARRGMGDPEIRSAFLTRQRRDKPQYLDLDSALMTGVAPRMWRRRGSGHVEEALPAVRDGRHALEWLLEFDRTGADGFRLAASDCGPDRDRAPDTDRTPANDRTQQFGLMPDTESPMKRALTVPTRVPTNRAPSSARCRTDA